MKTAEKLFTVGLLGCLTMILLTSVYYMGAAHKQAEIEHRALKIDKDNCYSWQEIELMIFNEIQQ